MNEIVMSADGIASAIVGAAAGAGGKVWPKIRKASRIYAQGYAQALIDTAEAVASGDMTEEEGKNSARAASFFYYMMIAQATQVTLVAIQQFFDTVIALVKGQINAALPFPLLA